MSSEEEIIPRRSSRSATRKNSDNTNSARLSSNQNNPLDNLRKARGNKEKKSTKTASRSQPGSSSSKKKSKTSSTKNKTKSTANNSRNSNDNNQHDIGEINRSLLSSFVEVFRSTEFQQHEELKIANAKLDIPCLLNWIVSVGFADTAGKSPMSTIYKICQVKVDRLKEKRE